MLQASTSDPPECPHKERDPSIQHNRIIKNRRKIECKYQKCIDIAQSRDEKDTLGDELELKRARWAEDLDSDSGVTRYPYPQITTRPIYTAGQSG
jgi:hypothetical protein